MKDLSTLWSAARQTTVGSALTLDTTPAGGRTTNRLSRTTPVTEIAACDAVAGNRSVTQPTPSGR
ncbi:MAG TPA: hypothetical protein VHW96_08440 [Solirubrobacteraceae bacterium]|nr:hypothetical protein [Solirubrobacteraceae bacterium]